MSNSVLLNPINANNHHCYAIIPFHLEIQQQDLFELNGFPQNFHLVSSLELVLVSFCVIMRASLDQKTTILNAPRDAMSTGFSCVRT